MGRWKWEMRPGAEKSGTRNKEQKSEMGNRKWEVGNGAEKSGTRNKEQKSEVRRRMRDRRPKNQEPNLRLAGWNLEQAFLYLPRFGAPGGGLRSVFPSPNHPLMNEVISGP